MSSNQKHDTHKYRPITPSLDEEKDNFTSWKRDLFAVCRDRGLIDVILGTDTCPPPPDATEEVAVALLVRKEISQWSDCNSAAYNQILLNISKVLQPRTCPRPSSQVRLLLLFGRPVHDSILW